MSKRDIGEFKISGFVIGIALCLFLALILYFKLSSKMESPKQGQEVSTVAFFLKRIEKLEAQVTAERSRIETLEREVEILKTSRRYSPSASSEQKKRSQ